ncbi:MAG: FAD-binding protein, partial [Rivularia sp. (in: cyanobacteria)]
PDEKTDKIASEFFYTVFPYGIVINPITGKRIVNELADRKTRADAILNVGQPCIGIADLKGTYISGHNIDKHLNRDIINIFQNLEKLALAYNLPDKALKETINQYNNYVENYRDEEFQKPIPIDAKPLQPPYYAIRLWPKVHYTMGGVEINTKAQVIDINNQPIPNLYAAGEVTGGIHGASRLGGCAVTECLVFGRIAGRNAALEISYNLTSTK